MYHERALRHTLNLATAGRRNIRPVIQAGINFGDELLKI
jgi:hypothetical protein